MRTLMLATDAFGGHGGIAKCNRDIIAALTAYPAMTEVVTIVRDVINELEPLPPKLTFVQEGLGGKDRYLAAVLKQLVQAPAFDLVLCCHINLLPAAILAKWRFRVPLVLWVHGIDAWTRPSSRAAAYACAYIEGFTSVSRLTSGRFQSWAPLEGKREWIVPNSIDLQTFTPGPKNEGLLDRYGLRGKRVLATLGRLVAAPRMKGVDEVLELMPRLRAKWPDLAYLVMGDGSDKDRLERKARALGVDEHVIFAGRVREQEKIEHYRLADAFVMPSKSEGFGFVFLEAMACGIPVVASAKDGGREAVREGMLGGLVDPDSPDDIVRGIEEALAKPRGAVPAGLEYFAFDRFKERVHAFLDDVRSIKS
jgi:glycosyltransferase involved in cell wall biosynthesis